MPKCAWFCPQSVVVVVVSVECRHRHCRLECVVVVARVGAALVRREEWPWQSFGKIDTKRPNSIGLEWFQSDLLPSVERPLGSIVRTRVPPRGVCCSLS